MKQDELKGLRCTVDVRRHDMEHAVIYGQPFSLILKWKLEQAGINLQEEYDKTWKDYLEQKKDELTEREREKVDALFAAKPVGKATE